MNWKKAFLTGTALWAVIFFEVSILMFGFGLQKNIKYYSIHFILLALFILLASLIYFKDERHKGAKSGLMLGLVFLLTGIALDAIITVPLFVKDYGFFIDPYMLAGYAGTLIIPIIVSVWKK